MNDKKIDKQDLVDALCDLTLLDAGEVADMLKERLNIPDLPMGGMLAQAPAGGADSGEAAPVKEDFTVILESFGERKTQVIKAVREIKKKEGQDIGLKEAKEMVETPNAKICENIPKEKADEYLKLLQEAGSQSKLD